MNETSQESYQMIFDVSKPFFCVLCEAWKIPTWELPTYSIFGSEWFYGVRKKSLPWLTLKSKKRLVSSQFSQREFFMPSAIVRWRKEKLENVFELIVTNSKKNALNRLHSQSSYKPLQKLKTRQKKSPSAERIFFTLFSESRWIAKYMRTNPFTTKSTDQKVNIKKAEKQNLQQHTRLQKSERRRSDFNAKSLNLSPWRHQHRLSIYYRRCECCASWNNSIHQGTKFIILLFFVAWINSSLLILSFFVFNFVSRLTRSHSLIFRRYSTGKLHFNIQKFRVKPFFKRKIIRALLPQKGPTNMNNGR